MSVFTAVVGLCFGDFFYIRSGTQTCLPLSPGFTKHAPCDLLGLHHSNNRILPAEQLGELLFTDKS